MAFIAATGTNYDEANSFVSLEFANSYHSDRGNTSWTGTDAVKQAALIKATDYIEQKYGQRFVGVRFDATDQLLSWPRTAVGYPEDVIPLRLKQAVCELALDALSGSLSPNISRDQAIKRERIEGAVDTEYFESAPMETIRPAVYGYLVPLLKGNSLNVAVVRA